MMLSGIIGSDGLFDASLAERSSRIEPVGRQHDLHPAAVAVGEAALSRMLGQDDEARKYVREDFNRIGWQIKPDGEQPLETARVDGLTYSSFNLQAQLTIARLAAPLGVDLWNFTAPNGGSIKQALEYLKPYDSAPEKWPHNQLAKQKPGFMKSSLEAAAKLDAEAKAIKK